MGKKRWSGQSVIEGRMPFPSLVGMLPEPALGWQVTRGSHVRGRPALQSSSFQEGPSQSPVSQAPVAGLGIVQIPWSPSQAPP